MPLVESISGIRGIYDNGLDEAVAERYAYSYISLLKEKNNGKKLTVVIGTDTRPSKDIIKNAVIGILDCDIIDLGIAPTPMAEFAVRYFKADGGIIITASHNEPYWNGFKFLDKDGAVLRPKDMEKVIKKCNAIKNLDNKKFYSWHLYKNKDSKKLTVKKIYKRYNEINNAYSNYVLSFLSNEEKNKIKNSKLKVIIDPNGGAGIVAKNILEKLNVAVHGVNMEYGIFGRIIEPDEDSLFYLANEVREKKYDFAAGFDCDADRVEIVTEKGIVSGNNILALIADNILKNSKNKVIVVNDATSNAVKDIAKKHKAKYIETGVGEINVVDKMYSLNAPIGGEGSSSGTIIPPSRCRDGILTLVYLLKIIAKIGKSLNELIKSLPEYYNIKRKVEIKSKDYKKIEGKIGKFYAKKGFRIKRVKEAKSLKAVLEDSFVWFRVSRTEADVLRIITDSNNKDKAEALMQEALNLVKSSND
ncbi:MAG: hypothetical protein AABX34_00480 [Nanoarchaeota archaeon]